MHLTSPHLTLPHPAAARQPPLRGPWSQGTSSPRGSGCTKIIVTHRRVVFSGGFSSRPSRANTTIGQPFWNRGISTVRRLRLAMTAIECCFVRMCSGKDLKIAAKIRACLSRAIASGVTATVNDEMRRMQLAILNGHPQCCRFLNGPSSA